MVADAKSKANNAASKQERYTILATAWLQAINLVKEREINENVQDWNDFAQACAMRQRLHVRECEIRQEGSLDVGESDLRKDFDQAEAALRESVVKSPVKRMYQVVYCIPPLQGGARATTALLDHFRKSGASSSIA